MGGVAVVALIGTTPTHATMIPVSISKRSGGMIRVSSRFRAASIFLAAGSVLAITAGSASAKEPASVRMLELEGALMERPSPFGWLFKDDNEPTLRNIIDSIHDAAEDPELDAVVIRMKDSSIGTTQIEELGKAVQMLREGGKKVSLFAEAYGPAEFMLASFVDDVVIQAGGPVSLPGLHMEEMFLADTLAWIGVKADMVQVGDYKGAAEQMGRSSPSPQWEQNITSLLDSLYGNMRSMLKSGRNLTDAQLDAAMNNLWLADADDAKASGLIDTVVDFPNLTTHLESRLDGTITWGSDLGHHSHAAMMPANPLALFSMLSSEPDTTPDGPTIAVVHIDGPIVDGDSTVAGFLGGEESVGSRTIRRALEDIIDEDMIKGVVVRIDSPGGSATASEVIWQGLRRLADKKPVWVSVGSMAASGGYYCAVAGDKIYVNPSSIVGSIGVVGGKMSMAGLYDKVKVNITSRSRGPRAAMFDTTKPWSTDELAVVRAKMQQTYDLFTSRVTAGRKDIDLSKTAEGRLFTGNVAVGLKMADAVGGLNNAVADLAESLQLAEYDVMDYPGPKALDELFGDMMSGFIHAPAAPGARTAGSSAIAAEAAALIREVLGDRAWRQIRGPMRAMMQLRDEPVLLTMPRALIFR
jgi:protease IV